MDNIVDNFRLIVDSTCLNRSYPQASVLCCCCMVYCVYTVYGNWYENKKVSGLNFLDLGCFFICSIGMFFGCFPVTGSMFLYRCTCFKPFIHHAYKNTIKKLVDLFIYLGDT